MRALIAVAVLVSVAHADKPACKKGDVLLRVERAPIKDAKGVRTFTLQLYGGGALEVDTIGEDGKKSHDSDCALKTVVSELTKIADAVPWTIVKNGGPACAAVSSTKTIYTWRGKQRFVEYICGGDALDDKSAKALDTIRQKIAVYTSGER